MSSPAPAAVRAIVTFDRAPPHPPLRTPHNAQIILYHNVLPIISPAVAIGDTGCRRLVVKFIFVFISSFHFNFYQWLRLVRVTLSLSFSCKICAITFKQNIDTQRYSNFRSSNEFGRSVFQKGYFLGFHIK